MHYFSLPGPQIYTFFFLFQKSMYFLFIKCRYIHTYICMIYILYTCIYGDRETDIPIYINTVYSTHNTTYTIVF